MAGARDALMSSEDEVGVLVFVNVYNCVGAKINRIGASDKCRVIQVRIKDFGSERFPSARRAAIKKAGPALADAAEALFDFGEQLVIDGVAVGPLVCGVDCVGVVIELGWMLDFDNKESWKIGSRPCLIKAISFLLLDEVVAVDTEALAVFGLQLSIGRFSSEGADVGREMTVKDHERVSRIGTCVEAFRQQHMGPEKNWLSPEFAEALTLNADVFDVFCIGRLREGRDFFTKPEHKLCRLC